MCSYINCACFVGLDGCVHRWMGGGGGGGKGRYVREGGRGACVCVRWGDGGGGGSDFILDICVQGQT